MPIADKNGEPVKGLAPKQTQSDPTIIKKALTESISGLTEIKNTYFKCLKKGDESKAEDLLKNI